MSIRNAVEPFYFADAKTLFACCHLPNDANEEGVVLCYPMGHEYIRTHRLYRQLSHRLANAGFHVLRFDYYATGDSAGDSADTRIERYVQDAVSAIEELRQRFQVKRVYMAGLRLGATVAALAGAEHGGLEGTVLWDPILNGQYSLIEAFKLHKELLRYPSEWRPQGERDERPLELLGFPMSTAMLKDLERLDLLNAVKPPAPAVLLVDSGNEPGQERLLDSLRKIGTRVEYQRIPHAKIWTGDPYNMFLPSEVIQTVVAWISRKK